MLINEFALAHELGDETRRAFTATHMFADRFVVPARGDEIWMVLIPWMNLGPLSGLPRRVVCGERVVADLMVQPATVVATLNAIGIVHRDAASRIFLLQDGGVSGDEFSLKLSDFARAPALAARSDAARHLAARRAHFGRAIFIFRRLVCVWNLARCPSRRRRDVSKRFALHRLVEGVSVDRAQMRSAAVGRRSARG
jgi:hypothetical protein